MTDKEILIAKLAIFLEEYGAYNSYIAGLANHGARKNTIDELAEWCINNKIEDEIIRMSFNWEHVELRSTYTWRELHFSFRARYNSIQLEYPDPQWDNMWEE